MIVGILIISVQENNQMLSDDNVIFYYMYLATSGSSTSICSSLSLDLHKRL